MTKNILTIFAVEIKCKKIFNIVDNFYKHRDNYDSKIFFVLMIIRCHNERQNKKFDYHTNFKNNNEKTFFRKLIELKMKIRLKNLKNFMFIKYINDDDFDIEFEFADDKKTKI